MAAPQPLPRRTGCSRGRGGRRAGRRGAVQACARLGEQHEAPGRQRASERSDREDQLEQSLSRGGQLGPGGGVKGVGGGACVDECGARAGGVCCAVLCGCWCCRCCMAQRRQRAWRHWRLPATADRWGRTCCADATHASMACSSALTRSTDSGGASVRSTWGSGGGPGRWVLRRAWVQPRDGAQN